MKATIRPYWIFSSLLGKGFLALQLYDERTNASLICACIPENEN